MAKPTPPPSANAALQPESRGQETHAAPDGSPVAEEPQATGAATATAEDEVGGTVVAGRHPTPPSSGRRGRVLRVLGDARVAWVVAVMALAAAVAFASLWAPLYTQTQERERVRAAATDLALRLTTFEGADIETWVAEAKDRATGRYAEQIEVLFDQALRDELREADVVSRGEILDLFVQGVDGDSATVFAVVRQTIVNNALSDPVEDELRMEISLELVEGRWLASDVAVLGPASLAAPTQRGGAGG